MARKEERQQLGSGWLKIKQEVTTAKNDDVNVSNKDDDEDAFAKDDVDWAEEEETEWIEDTSEKTVKTYETALLPKVAHIFKQLFEEDVLEEEVVLEWSKKKKKKGKSPAVEDEEVEKGITPEVEDEAEGVDDKKGGKKKKTKKEKEEEDAKKKKKLNKAMLAAMAETLAKQKDVLECWEKPKEALIEKSMKLKEFLKFGKLFKDSITLRMTQEKPAKQLKRWIKLSTSEKVPPSPLLLSRTLYLPDTMAPAQAIKANIDVLPEVVTTGTKAKQQETEQVEQLSGQEAKQVKQLSGQMEAQLHTASKEQPIVQGDQLLQSLVCFIAMMAGNLSTPLPSLQARRLAMMAGDLSTLQCVLTGLQEVEVLGPGRCWDPGGGPRARGMTSTRQDCTRGDSELTSGLYPGGKLLPVTMTFLIPGGECAPTIGDN